MENKKTEELRKYKASIKSKLMAAIAMLMVSTILLSSTTYAWFILSTAPEVKGMTTTVGSNGSLEIALLDDLDTANNETYAAMLTSITSGVGDSSVASSVKASNLTWGNIVDLNDTSYGLGSIQLYPAALNLNSTDNTKLFNLYAMLQYPTYGVDGRVATLSPATEAGKLIDGAFNAKNTYYGVRAVGTVEDKDPKAYAFETALETFTLNLTAAKNNAKGSLDSYGTELTNMAVKEKTTENATFTVKEVKNIALALEGLESAATNLENAIRAAYAAYYVSTQGEVLSSDTTVTLDTIGAVSEFSAYVTALKNYQSALNGVTIPDTETDPDATFVWDDIEDALSALIDTNGMTINGHTIDEIRPAAEAFQSNSATDAQRELINELMNQPVVAVKSGLYSDVANFTDEYTSQGFDLVVLINISGATINVQKATGVDTAYGAPVAAYLNGSLTPPAGNAQSIITTTYGYVVDLAFRASTGTDLLLSEAVNRVADDAATQGSGTSFTIPTSTSATDVAKIGKSLRVVFIDTETYTILGVAGLTATGTDLAPTTDGKYALHMYNYTVGANNAITLTGQKMKDVTVDGQTQSVADDKVASLTANTAKGISVLVYLDGNFMDSSMNGVMGNLNLQFASSATLTPMSYSDWVTTGDTQTETTTTVSGTVTWANDTEADRPESITVGIYAGNSETAAQTVTVTPDAEGNWTYSVTSLPKNDAQGAAITYTVKVESTVAGYDTPAITGTNIAFTKTTQSA